MKRVAAIVVAAALVGGLGGAGIALALGGSNDSTDPDGQSAVSLPIAAQTGAQLTPEAIYARAAPSVVVISATEKVKVPATFFTPPSSENVQIGGSGFVVDKQGDIVTNDHVVQSAANVRVGFFGGATYPAKVVGTDATTDLAVIHARPQSQLEREDELASRVRERDPLQGGLPGSDRPDAADPRRQRGRERRHATAGRAALDPFQQR